MKYQTGGQMRELAAEGEVRAHLIQLRQDATHVAVLFTGPGEPEPDPAITHELRVFERQRDTAQRRGGWFDILTQEAQSGVVGGAAFAALTGACAATRSWLTARRNRTVNDAAQAVVLVRTAAQTILGQQSLGTLDVRTITRQPDGSWKVLASLDDGPVEAVLDPSGSVLDWNRTPLITPPGA
ncbi:hypothetical protein [Streptomyces sp. NPDC093223]|uniref:hypothetical protein n=1 Tax=Streptomyces sp. NPDC093223 TaxID=3366033 RepID=UPI00382045EF